MQGGSGLLFPTNRGQNALGVKNTPSPGSTAHLLERGPQTGVIRQGGIGRKERMRWTLGQDFSAASGGEGHFALSNKIECSGEGIPVDQNFNLVAIPQFADGTARQAFRANMADAGAG